MKSLKAGKIAKIGMRRQEKRRRNFTVRGAKRKQLCVSRIYAILKDKEPGKAGIEQAIYIVE